MHGIWLMANVYRYVIKSLVEGYLVEDVALVVDVRHLPFERVVDARQVRPQLCIRDVAKRPAR